MISVTGVTNHYSLQPALLDKHSRTLSWLSVTMHWKSELAFFHKMLNEARSPANSREVKAEIEDLETQVVYYAVEGIEELRKKLRNHESRLAKMLESKAEWDTQYYKEHDELMESAVGLSATIDDLIEKLRSSKVLKQQSHNQI